MATVTFHRRLYAGELLYCYTYPVKTTDEKGRVTGTVQHPQRVGLLINGVVVHFTVPEKVEM
jgi:hypothetical protein